MVYGFIYHLSATDSLFFSFFFLGYLPYLNFEKV